MDNKANISFIEKWLSIWHNGKKPLKKVLLCVGECGIGKTYTIRKILKNENYEPVYLNSSNIPKSGDLVGYLKELSSMADISFFFQKKKTKVIVIDNLESLCKIANQSIKEFVKILLNTKKNTFKVNIPVIFISNDIHLKIITIMKNIIAIKYFNTAETDTLNYFAKNIIKKENLKIDEKNICNFVEKSKGDLRQLLYIIKYTKNNRNFTLKNNKWSLCDATMKLLVKYNGIEKSISYFNTDNFKLPMMLYQNFLQNAIEREEKDEVKHKIICEINRNFVYADKFSDIIYGKQYKELLLISAMIVGCYNSFILNQMKSDDYYSIKKIKYEKISTNDNIIKINKKNMYYLQYVLPDNNITNIFLIRKILMLYIYSKKKNHDVFMRYVKFYNLNMKHVEFILKLDKIDDSYRDLNTNCLKKIFNI
jgi:DNA polymerase III delta prime subunit